MKRQIKVLMADPSKEFRSVFAELVEREEDLTLVGQTDDGEELLRLAAQTKPDVAVMELLLSGMDGLEVLERLAGKTPVLALTGKYASAMAELAVEKGAGYCMLKPCRPSALMDRIRQLAWSGAREPEADPFNQRALGRQVTDILREIGVPAHIKGYPYLREAIMITVKDPGAIRGVTKVLYPGVARKYGVTASQVERAIRSAVVAAWERNDAEVQKKYFGYVFSGGKGKPTNSELIAAIVNHILSGRDEMFG